MRVGDCAGQAWKSCPRPNRPACLGWWSRGCRDVVVEERQVGVDGGRKGRHVGAQFEVQEDLAYDLGLGEKREHQHRR